MKFISFEGLDGSGKSTLIRKCAEMLEKLSFEVLVLREPGSTSLGESIRKYLLKDDSVRICPRSEALLFAASRAQMYEEMILPNKDKKGLIILCDRFLASSQAYQGGGYGLGYQAVTDINDFGINGFRPDMTFFLDVSEDVRRCRLGEDLDKIESRDDLFYIDTKAEYLAHCVEDCGELVTINADLDTRELANVVCDKIIECILKEY